MGHRPTAEGERGERSATVVRRRPEKVEDGRKKQPMKAGVLAEPSAAWVAADVNPTIPFGSCMMTAVRVGELEWRSDVPHP